MNKFGILQCVCGKNFNTLLTLKTHEKRCSTYKQYIEDFVCVHKDKKIDDIVQLCRSKFTIEEILTHVKKCRDEKYVCKCGQKFSTVKSFDNHKVRCSLWLEYKGSVLSKEFFDEYCGKQKLPFPVIVSDVLNNKEFSYYLVVKEAVKFGYKPMIASQAMKHKIVQQKQRNSVRQKYGVDNVSQSQEIKDKKVDTMMKKFGVSHHLKLASQIEKRDKTCLEKYGVTNVSQLQKVKSKKEQTFLNHYGVSNIFCDTSYIEKCTVAKLGVRNVSLRADIVTKKLKRMYDQCSNLSFYKISKIASSLFLSLSENLKQHGVVTYFSCENHHNEYCIYNEDISFIALIDFVVTYRSKKVAVEFYGDFFHMNPNVYVKSDVNVFLNKTAGDLWNHDKNRLETIKSLGLPVLVVWEKEFIENRDLVISETVDFIRNALDLSKPRLRRRKSI